MDVDLSGFDFRSSFRDISAGMVVKPILHTYLFDASFPAFDLHFEKQDMERKPDDWFHPSTHPDWPAMALYHYLSQPDTFPVEKKQYMGTLSVTLGKVMHEFVQVCLTDTGIMPPEMQVCSVCPPEANCSEAGVVNAELGERGHVDGLLNLSALPSVSEEMSWPVFEFKTSHDNFGRLSGVEDMDLEAFRKKWPKYWSQQQRYQHLFGLRYSIVLMMETMYPWTMKEFHIPYDLGWNLEVDTKYRIVRQAVADQQPPGYCCGFKSCDAAPICGRR